MKDQSPDRMIRDTLSNPKYAVSFFKETLPAPVLNRIDIASLNFVLFLRIQLQLFDAVDKEELIEKIVETF